MTEEKEQDVEVEETGSTPEALKDQVEELEKELQKRELMINLLCDEISRLEEGD